MKALFAALAAFAALSAAVPQAQAQTFNELMEDLGLKARQKHKMDFSERAPLALPPSYDLPPPEEGGSLASINPYWPKDADEAAEEAVKRRADERDEINRRYGEGSAQEIYHIRRQERERGGGDFSDPNRGTSYEAYRNDPRLTPQELQEVRKRREAEAANAGPVVYVEPERKRLSEPPPGYRLPDPSEPYRAPEEEKKKGFFSKLNPFK